MSPRRRLSRLLEDELGPRPAGRPAASRAVPGWLLAVVLAVSALVSLGLLSFAGWLAYLLVMHFTHGGAS